MSINSLGLESPPGPDEMQRWSGLRLGWTWRTQAGPEEGRPIGESADFHCRVSGNSHCCQTLIPQRSMNSKEFDSSGMHAC